MILVWNEHWTNIFSQSNYLVTLVVGLGFNKGQRVVSLAQMSGQGATASAARRRDTDRGQWGGGVTFRRTNDHRASAVYPSLCLTIMWIRMERWRVLPGLPECQVLQSPLLPVSFRPRKWSQKWGVCCSLDEAAMAATSSTSSPSYTSVSYSCPSTDEDWT